MERDDLVRPTPGRGDRPRAASTIDALTDLEAAEERWAPARDGLLERDRTGFVRLRSRAATVQGFRSGRYRDPRPGRIDELEESTWDDFELFWANEAASPFTILIQGTVSEEVQKQLEALGTVQVWTKDALRR